MEKIGVVATVEDADTYLRTIDKINGAAKTFATESGAAFKKSADLVQDAAGRWRTASGQFATDAQKAAAGIETVAPASKKAGDAAKKAGTDAETGGAGFKAFGEIAIGALREVGAVAVHALGDAARAVTGFMKDSIGLAGDFDQGMRDFAAVAGKDIDAKGIAQFRQQFLDLGKELPVSTDAVQDAAIEMVKGGIDPAIVAAGGLRQNIQFAAAALNGDLAAAAETSAKLLGGWVNVTASADEKVKFLTSSTDLLTKAANASSVDVIELRNGIFNAQGTAKAAGVEFEDLTIALAELAPRFASSNEAGTALKNVIVRLQPTTKPAIAAMQSLGLITEDGGNKFYDAQGKFVGFQKASELLRQSMAGLTNQQKVAIQQTIFGNDGMSAAAALTELGAEGYDAMATSIANANGVQETATLKQQGFNTALDNAKGSVEALQITVGTYLLPILTQLMNDVIAPAVNTLTTFADAVFGSDDAMSALSPTLQDIAGYVGDVGYAFKDWYDGVLSLQDALNVLSPGLGSIVAPIESLVGALSDNLEPILFGIATAITVAVVPAMVAATASFLAAAAPIVALIAVGALLYKAWTEDWGGIQEVTASVWASLQPTFEAVQTWLETNIPIAIKTVSDYWTNTLQPALAQVWAFIDKNILPILSDLADTYLAALIAEVKGAAAMWEDVLWPALKVVWSFLKDDLIPIISALVDVNLAVMQKAGEAIAGVWQKVLLPAITSVSEYISATFGPAIKEIGDWLSSTFGPTLQTVTDYLGEVTGGFSGIGDAVKGVVAKLHEFADMTRGITLPPWLTPGSPTPWEIALRGIGNALQTEVIPGVNSFGSALSGMGTAAAGAATDITAQLGDTLTGGNLVKDAKALGKNVIGGLVSGIENNLRAIDKAADKAADKVKDAFAGSFDSHSPAGITIPFGESLITGVAKGLMDAAPGLYGLINQVGAQLVITAGKKINDSIREQNAEITAGLEDMVKDIQSKIGDFNISILSGGADVDRQKAANLSAMDELGRHAKGIAQQQLEDAAKIAATLNDPKQQADYFKARSDAILEMAQLQDKLDTQLDPVQRGGIERSNEQLIAQMADMSKSADERESISRLLAANQAKLKAANLLPSQIESLKQQIALINSAQQKEGAAQGLSMAQGSESGNITKGITDLLSQLQGVKDSPITVFDPVIKQFMALIGQLSTTPAAAQQATQYASGGTGASYATNINMPIYTNQSPAVMQQSMAIIGATL